MTLGHGVKGQGKHALYASETSWIQTFAPSLETTKITKVGQSLLILGHRSQGQIARACFAELAFGNPQHARALYCSVCPVRKMGQVFIMYLIVLHSPKLPRFLDSSFTVPHTMQWNVYCSSQQQP